MRINFAVKIAICLGAGAAVTCAGFGYANLRLQRKHLEDAVLESADRMSDLIQRSTKFAMVRNDRDALYQTIRDIGAEPGIRRIRIFDSTGKIGVSTDAREPGTVVDKQGEACYGCHARNEPLIRLERKERARTFFEGGERVLGVIRPIDNEPSCWNADCHAHPKTQRVLGVIDAHLSLAGVDAASAQYQQQVLWLTLLSMGLVCGITILFSWSAINRPVHALIAGMRRVSKGDLKYRLPIRSNDELGEMAASFNHMATDLERANGEIMEWTHTLEERAAQKATELERAWESVANAERMASLGKLAATVAHEVNNPLMGILTYARLTRKAIEKSDPAPAGKDALIEQLEIIEHESRRCGEVMRNLLMFARKAPRVSEPHDVNALIQRATRLIRHQLDIRGIELQEFLDPDLAQVQCDAGQIQQVVLGLLMNAVEAMGDMPGGRLWVSTEMAEQGVAIRVGNNGPGIPPEVLPHIFEPFFTTKTDEQRTGLGLAVARSIAEQHGGNISAESDPVRGVEFTIRVPLDFDGKAPDATA